MERASIGFLKKAAAAKTGRWAHSPVQIDEQKIHQFDLIRRGTTYQCCWCAEYYTVNRCVPGITYMLDATPYIMYICHAPSWGTSPPSLLGKETGDP